ncbi:MAG: hypothetical protein Q7S75_02320 [bacterium]|nr:hypothetical protein [bacterium]
MHTPTTKETVGMVALTAFISLFGSLFLIFTPAYAQFGNAGAGARVFLSMNPSYPGPNERVHVSLESSVIDLSQSEITWYVNNKIFAQGTGLREADIVAGTLGTKTDISVIAQTSDGTSASGDATISPANVDLLWESDSYIPPFYRGRALASSGTSIRISAIVQFKPIGSLQVPEGNIVYSWKRNGSVVGSASGKGRSFAVFPSPSLFGTDTIEVVASTVDGSQKGSGEVRISSIEPVLTLYQDHPLFGIMYNQALGNTTSLSDAEATFAAVPYFADADSPDDARLIYAWSVNGNSVQTDELKRSGLTVNADRSNGLAQIALSITHAANLAMQSSDAWRVSFGTDNSGFIGVNPLLPSSQ